MHICGGGRNYSASDESRQYVVGRGVYSPYCNLGRYHSAKAIGRCHQEQEHFCKTLGEWLQERLATLQSQNKELKEYKKVKDHNGVTGNGRKTFKYYSKLDEILGHRSASAPSVLLDTGLTTAESQESSDAEQEERKCRR